MPSNGLLRGQAKIGSSNNPSIASFNTFQRQATDSINKAQKQGAQEIINAPYQEASPIKLSIEGRNTNNLFKSKQSRSSHKLNRSSKSAQLSIDGAIETNRFHVVVPNETERVALPESVRRR
jgi:protein tyrosine phosphatase